jgi:hypothetical protein
LFVRWVAFSIFALPFVRLPSSMVLLLSYKSVYCSVQSILTAACSPYFYHLSLFPSSPREKACTYFSVPS